MPENTVKRGRPIEAKLKCIHCKRRRPRDMFYANSGSNTGKANVCIPCNTEYCSLRKYRRILKTGGTEAICEMIRERHQQIWLMRRVLYEETGVAG